MCPCGKAKKSHLIIKMELAIFLSIASSVIYAALGGAWHLLQLIPAAMLLCAFAKLYNHYRKDFLTHFIAFSAFYILIVFAPYIIQKTLPSASAFEMLNYLVLIAFALLFFFIFLKALLKRREIDGKVLLADRNIAVVSVDFDFFAGIKAGEYVVKNKGAKKGDLVRISLKNKLFGGAVPEKIVKK